MIAHKLRSVTLVLVCVVLAQPAFAQRGGGGGGGGGGGHCSGGGLQSPSNVASSQSPYMQNSLGNPYALQQMQQQYAQQAMAMRQMYAMQMENQMLRNQMMQMQKNAQLANEVAEVKLPIDANGNSNVLLASKKNSVKNTTAATKKKSRTVAQGEKQQKAEKADTDKLAMNDIK